MGPTGPTGPAAPSKLLQTAFQSGSGASLTAGTPTSVVAAPISITTGSGEKLVITGTVGVSNGGGSPQKHEAIIVIDGVNVAVMPTQVPSAGVIGAGGNIGVQYETVGLTAGAHTVDLQVLTSASFQSSSNAQLQVLRVTA